MAITKVTSGLISADASSIDLNIDAGTLYLDVSENRVGIGTSSPSQPLTVSKAGDLYIQVNNSSAGYNTYLGTYTNESRIVCDGAKPIAFFVNGSRVVDFANGGNVGIGTDNPTDTYNYGKVLDIHGSTGAVTYLRDEDATSNFGFVAYDGGSENRMVVGAGGTAYLRFVSGGSECGRFDTSGRLGIGTDNPQSILDINATSPILTIESDDSQDSKILFKENGFSSVSLFYEGSAGTGTSNNLHIRSELSGSETNLVTFGLDGNVGIGTDNPAVELDVYGDGSGVAVGRPWGNDAYVSSGYFGKLANTAAGGGWNAGSAFMKIEDSLTTGVRKGTNIDFVTHNYGTGNQTTMTLSAEGNVGINNSSPAAQLHIRPVNDSGDAVVIIEADVNNDVESDNPMLYFKQDGAAVVGRICYTSNNVFEIINQYNSSLIIGRNNTTDISINTSGVVSGDFNDTSDINLKENISNIDGGLSVVNQLRAVNFDWKSDEKQNGKAGFIAQEVEEILPNEIAENDSGKSINSTAILAHAIKAIQEQQAQIETLKQEIREIKESG